ncbi:hypothetical protein ACTXT7_007039 [Hymenolepis weldensis]
MCEIVNLIVTPNSLPINILCPQVTYPNRSEKLTKLSSDNSCRGTADSACPDQLKHAHNHDLMRVLIEALNINSLSSTYTPSTHTHTHKVVINKLSTRYSAGSCYLEHSLVELGVK